MAAFIEARTLEDAFSALNPKYEELLLGNKTPEESERAAQDVVRVCRVVRDSLYTPDGLSVRENLLKEKNIPFNQADRLAEMLTEHRIQGFDLLKRELSIATRFLMELVVFKYKLQKRSIIQSSIDPIKSKIEEMLKGRSILKEEIVTRFELRCCLAAIKKINTGEEVAKDLVVKNAKNFGFALLQTFFTASPIPPYISVQYLAPAIADMTLDFYNFLEEPWYKAVWLLRWTSAEERISTIQTYKEILSQLPPYQTQPMLAFYISQLSMGIIKKDNVDEELKQELIEGNQCQSGLFQLAEFHPPRVYLQSTRFFNIPVPHLKDNFWKTRYLTLTYLFSLVLGVDSELSFAHATSIDQKRDLKISDESKNEEQNRRIVQIIARQAIEMRKDKLGRVKKLALSLLAEIGIANHQLVKDALYSIHLDEKLKKFESIDHVIEEVFIEENPKIVEEEQLLEKSQSRRLKYRVSPLTFLEESSEEYRKAFNKQLATVHEINRLQEISEFKKESKSEIAIRVEEQLKVLSLINNAMENRNWEQLKLCTDPEI